MLRFVVETRDDGDVYINDKFIAQLCFCNDAIGSAVTNYLNDVEYDNWDVVEDNGEENNSDI